MEHGTRITLELPEALHERLVEVSRRSGASLDATILELVEQGLTRALQPSAPTASANGTPEGGQPQATLREQIQQFLDTVDSRRRGRTFDPEVAARRRAELPKLDPPISQTIIEDRADRV